MARTIITLLAAIILAACSATTEVPVNSGIEGQVFIGPMCPAVQIGQECPDQPYQAVITVNSPNGERIVQFETDENGRFKIPLAPGEYVLHPESPNSLPFADEQVVLVKDGEYTEVVVNYDSGIR
jgi:hypothetical protein